MTSYVISVDIIRAYIKKANSNLSQISDIIAFRYAGESEMTDLDEINIDNFPDLPPPSHQYRDWVPPPEVLPEGIYEMDDLPPVLGGSKKDMALPPRQLNPEQKVEERKRKAEQMLERKEERKRIKIGEGGEEREERKKKKEEREEERKEERKEESKKKKEGSKKKKEERKEEERKKKEKEREEMKKERKKKEEERKEEERVKDEKYNAILAAEQATLFAESGARFSNHY